MGTAPPIRSHRAKFLIAGVACALVAVAAAGFLAWRSPAGGPPPLTAGPVTLAKFAGSAAFNELPEDRKEPYVRALQRDLGPLIAAAERGELTRDDRIALARNVMRARARLEARTYAGLTDAAARRAHLDQLIAEQELVRRHDPEGTAAPDLALMKQFMETLPPEERVRLAGLALDLIKRRTERGLSPLPIPGLGR